jgi:hypothetical protein
MYTKAHHEDFLFPLWPLATQFPFRKAPVSSPHVSFPFYKIILVLERKNTQIIPLILNTKSDRKQNCLNYGMLLILNKNGHLFQI